jgi:hypothetical protein
MGKDLNMERVQAGEATQLSHLFEAELQYRSDMEPVVPPEGREGALIGNGDGSVQGEKLRGTMRWSMYSGDCAYVFVQAGVEPPPGQHLCTVHPGGVIETGEGARIWFDARGYGLRGYDQTQPHLWRLTMGIQFKTTDERYQWLNTTLGVMTSEFDESSGRARWQANIPQEKA